MNEQSWWLDAQQAGYSAFYEYARREFERMSAMKESQMVDAMVRANIATFHASKKPAGGLGMTAGAI